MSLLEIKFFKSISSTFLLNVAEAAFGFLTAILLTRLVGASTFGAYSYVVAMVGLLSTLAVLGQDRLMVKEFASEMGDTSYRTSLLINSSIVVFVLTTITISFYYLFLLLTTVNEERFLPLVALPLLLIITITNKIFEAFLQGHHSVVQSYFAVKLVKPMCMIFGIACIYFLVDDLTAQALVVLNAVAGVAALLYLLLAARPHFFNVKRNMLVPRIDTELFKKGLPFALISSISVINSNIDMVMLAQYVSNEQLGVYRVVHRVTSLTAFALTAVNAVFGPRISAFYAEQNFSEMQRLAVLSAIAVAAIAIPTSAILIFKGNLVLLVFGQEFVQGDVTLKIMVIGQLVNVFTGSVGLILAMTSYARKVSTSLALACITNIVINLLLIPVMGINGAALATVASVAMVNLINLYWVITKLKINPTIFGVFKLRSDVKI